MHKLNSILFIISIFAFFVECAYVSALKKEISFKMMAQSFVEGFPENLVYQENKTFDK